jgi:CheY-like chemotaxis protein
MIILSVRTSLAGVVSCITSNTFKDMNVSRPNIVFYLDDDPDDRNFFQEALAEIGAQAMLFASADAMLDNLRHASQPAIIFMDLNMPLKNGFETLEEIRREEAFAHIPIVVLSTSAAMTGVDRCFKLGASLYLTKPNRMSVLRESIAGIMEINWPAFHRDRSNFMCRYK